MKIYHLTKTNRDIFRGLDPFERLVILDNPCGFALACITDEKKEPMPAGLLVGTVTGDVITIDWIAVNPFLQGKGIGEKLLLTVYDMADAGKIENICAVISEDYEREDFSKGGGSYFEEHLFEYGEKAFGDFVLSLSELARLPYFKQDSARLPKPTTLSSFSVDEINGILEKLFSIKGAVSLSEPGYMIDVIDPELGFVFMDGDEPYGGFLVQEAGDYLMPVYYFAESDREGAALILASFEKALSKYKGRDVLILQREKENYKLLSDIMPGMDRSTMLWSKLSDYRNLC